MEQRLLKTRKVIVEWFEDMLGVGSGTGVTANFVDNLVIAVAGDYIDRNGEVTFDVEKTSMSL